jgi:hypothetical protein
MEQALLNLAQARQRLEMALAAALAAVRDETSTPALINQTLTTLNQVLPAWTKALMDVPLSAMLPETPPPMIDGEQTTD